MPIGRMAGGRLPDRIGAKVFLALSIGLVVSLGAGRALGADDDEPVPPKDVTLRTRDGVAIAATYYASEAGKDAVPVILLHAADGSRGDFRALALLLQRANHAVIAVDLRGHGDSTHNRDERVHDLRPDDLVAMVNQDVETVKNFLIERNNEGELNIEKLCIVGSQMGAGVAVNFAARDWSWPLLATGKQGQDVRGLVLVSPEWSYRGLRIHEAVAHPQVRTAVSVLIVAGKGNSSALREAKRLHSALARFHPPQPGATAEEQSLWLRTPSTRLQGTQLVNERRTRVDEIIAQFIEVQLAEKNIPWHERRKPLD